MTEGMLGGILGEEAEKPDIEASETLAGAEAFAAAVAAIASRQDPEVARKTVEFLSRQSKLSRLRTNTSKKSTRRAFTIFAVKRTKWTSAGLPCAFASAFRSFLCWSQQFSVLVP